jgi:hypothetical protein
MSEQQMDAIFEELQDIKSKRTSPLGTAKEIKSKEVTFCELIT